MQTFNWFFGLEDESDNKPAGTKDDGKPPAVQAVPAASVIAPAISLPAKSVPVTPAVITPAAPSGPSVPDAAGQLPGAAHRAQTGVFTAPMPDIKPTQQAAQPVGGQAKKSVAATQVAYVPGHAAPLAVATKAALQGAKAQLHGALPVNLSVGGSEGVVNSRGKASSFGKGKARQRIQTGLLVVTTLAVAGVAVWSFLPVQQPAKMVRQSEGHATSLPIPTQTPERPLPPQRDVDSASECLQEATEFRDSTVRDQLLLNAISEFDKGRIERARAFLKEYSALSCDRATLEAIAILDKQITSRSHDN